MKKLTGILIAIALLFGIAWIGKTTLFKNQPVRPTPAATQSAANYFSYRGENGKNALAILKEKAKVRMGTSGMVTSINGRVADDRKHEYWGFFVNTKLADVGPGDYQTKNSDIIEWKIEKY